MKKWRVVLRTFGSCCALSALMMSAGVTTSVAGEDIEAMMAEGIPYADDKYTKTHLNIEDNRLTSEALMAEGIPYADGLLAKNAMVVNCDHEKRLRAIRSTESCDCQSVQPAIILSKNIL